MQAGKGTEKRATSTIRINTGTINIRQAFTEGIIDCVHGTIIIWNIPTFDQVQDVDYGVAQASFVAALFEKIEFYELNVTRIIAII